LFLPVIFIRSVIFCT